MRLLRGSTTLREFERGSAFSRSQLSAFENGHRLPHIEYAETLDTLYGAQGWIATAVRTLRRTRWEPWRSERAPSTHHAFGWHASYSGLVWIKVVPQPEAVGLRHEITSEWGPWGRTDAVELPALGVVLLTGKAADADGISHTYNVTVDQPVFALAGFGDALHGETVRDIRRGWQLVNPAARPNEHEHGPAGGTAQAGGAPHQPTR
jgi:hypothetical protein